MKLISILIFTFILAGCSLVPDSLEVANKNALVDYSVVSSAPEKHKGDTIRWGGVIAKLDNKQDITIVEIVQLPILHYGRPNVAKDSLGRYRVYVDDFLDPVVYQPGRSITFIGEVMGMETGDIGEHTYFYPTVKASGHELWSDIERIDITGFNSPYFGYPYYGRFYYSRGVWGPRYGHFGGFGGFNHQRAIIRKNPFRSSSSATNIGSSSVNRNVQRNNSRSVRPVRHVNSVRKQALL